MKNIIYLLLMFCVACSQGKKEEHKPFQIKLTDLTLEDSTLLYAFYGNAKSDSICVNPCYKSHLNCNDFPDKRMETDSIIKEKHSESLETIIADKILYGEDNTYCLLITSSSIEKFECHPCGAVLGLFILKKNDKGKWDCIQHRYDVRMQGSNSYISTDPKIYRISNTDFAVDLSDGFFQVGCYEQSAINLITPNKGFDQIDIDAPDEYFSYDNGGLCDSSGADKNKKCYSYDYYLEFNQPSSDNIYYDLNITVEGSREEKDKRVHEFRNVNMYSWIRNQYVLTGRATTE